VFQVERAAAHQFSVKSATDGDEGNAVAAIARLDAELMVDEVERSEIPRAMRYRRGRQPA
jgi:hypothetical protein